MYVFMYVCVVGHIPYINIYTSHIVCHIHVYMHPLGLCSIHTYIHTYIKNLAGCVCVCIQMWGSTANVSWHIQDVHEHNHQSKKKQTQLLLNHLHHAWVSSHSQDVHKPKRSWKQRLWHTFVTHQDETFRHTSKMCINPSINGSKDFGTLCHTSRWNVSSHIQDVYKPKH